MQSSEKMDLTVIIVNWNTGQLLSECVQSLKSEIKDINSQIIIIDNKSSDESVRQAKQSFPELIYIDNSVNGGFAKANNQGLQIAKGQFILFLNPDTRVQPNSIHILLHFLQ